ncbi:MAG TPA: hypothetical protein VEL76_28635 [Gemmataceae bacterium]|nr:hypothetical protein [Gemmataceae bacterium]
MLNSALEKGKIAKPPSRRRRSRRLRRILLGLTLLVAATWLGGWLGALLGLWAGPVFATFDHGHDSLREGVSAAVGALCGFVIGTISAFRVAALRR